MVSFYKNNFKLCSFDLEPYIINLFSISDDTTGWTSVATPEQLDFYCEFLVANKLVPDWKFVRGWIKELLEEEIESLTTEPPANLFTLVNLIPSEQRRKIAIKYFPNLVPLADQLNEFDLATIQYYSKEFNRKSKESRLERIENAEIFAFQNLTIQSCLLIMNETAATTVSGKEYDLVSLYKIGIEKFSADGYYGLWDYFEDLKTSPSFNNLQSISNLSVEEILEKIQNILIFGHPGNI